MVFTKSVFVAVNGHSLEPMRLGVMIEGVSVKT